MMINGARIIYNKLVQKNTEKVFLYSGGAIMSLIDCFYNKKEIDYYINTHEQNLGHCATGYARASSKPGICIVTSGPGLTNMVTPMLDAQNDGCPLLVLSGQVPLSAMGTQAFQEAPSIEITKPFTKWSYCVKDINELEDVIEESYNIMLNGRPGVVHIDLPKCILNTEVDKKFLETVTIQYNSSHIEINNKSDYNNEITELVNMINRSKKPVLYIGQGCNNASTILRKLAKKNNIPVTTTIHGLGIFDETDDLSLKFVGMHGSVYANKAIQESDCIIALGSRFDDRTIGNLEYYAPNAIKASKENRGGIIHCNISNKELNNIVNVDYAVKGDCGVLINKIIDLIEINKREDWLSIIHKWKKQYKFESIRCNNNNINSQDVIIELNKQTPNKEDYIFTSGVGNHQMFAAQFIDWRHPRSFISSGSLGVMGFGLPSAIGVSIAKPDKTVIDIDGDGSFLMTMSDMKTAKQYDLTNLKVLVLNNNTLGMVDIWEKLFYSNRKTATDNSYCPSFAEVARPFGFKTLICDNKKDLQTTINTFLNTHGPILCECVVEHKPCFPLVPPGNALDNIITNEDNITINNNSAPS